MELKLKSGAVLKWDSKRVECPSGKTMKTDHFPGMQYIAREALRGYEWFMQDLERLGLTIEDVQALAESPDPVAKQLMSRPEDRVRCAVCGRTLWSAESIARGIGPECVGKVVRHA